MASDISGAEAAIRATQARATRLVAGVDRTGRASLHRLLGTLQAADARLGERLRRDAAMLGGETARFTGAQATVYRAQVRLAIREVEAGLAGIVLGQSNHAIDSAGRDAVKLVKTLERRFAGIAQAIPLDAAGVLAGARATVVPSLLRLHASSVDRYGIAMIQEFEQRIAIGLMSGMSQHEMVDWLCEHAGPTGSVSMAARVVGGRVLRTRTEQIAEGLFRRHRYWAWRIVRTETARAYNLAKDESIGEMEETFPDLARKILAHFDDRTAEDSIAVHGQVRRRGEFFRDGAGRVYERPPARPNDRETLIPWRASWPETDATRGLTAGEQRSTLDQIAQARRQRGQGRRPPPIRPTAA